MNEKTNFTNLLNLINPSIAHTGTVALMMRNAF